MDCHFVNYREITARYTAVLSRNVETEGGGREREKESPVGTCNGYALTFNDARLTPKECQLNLRLVQTRFHDPRYEFARIVYTRSRSDASKTSSGRWTLAQMLSAVEGIWGFRGKRIGE